jgi:transcriptional regulator with XRE-family HTH domain
VQRRGCPLMTAKRLPGHSGPRLKAYRTALDITVRDVEAYSHHIARATENPAFILSHSYLSSLESGRRGVPSLHKLFTLSVIYRIRFVDLLLSYGLDLENISKFEMDVKLPRTHLIWHDIYDPERPISFPLRFDPGFKLEKTDLLTRMVETWGEIPIGFIQHLGIHKNVYGYVGTEDRTIYPLIRPGSIVVIDDRDTKIQTTGWNDDFDRPVYFLQLRDGYACTWCQLNGGKLSLIPYSTSKGPIRHYDYPQDVDVIGRVIGVAMTFGELPSKASLKPGDADDHGPAEQGPSKASSSRLLGDSLLVDLTETN